MILWQKDKVCRRSMRRWVLKRDGQHISVAEEAQPEPVKRMLKGEYALWQDEGIKDMPVKHTVQEAV